MPTRVLQLSSVEPGTPKNLSTLKEEFNNCSLYTVEFSYIQFEYSVSGSLKGLCFVL